MLATGLAKVHWETVSPGGPPLASSRVAQVTWLVFMSTRHELETSEKGEPLVMNHDVEA